MQEIQPGFETQVQNRGISGLTKGQKRSVASRYIMLTPKSMFSNCQIDIIDLTFNCATSGFTLFHMRLQYAAKVFKGTAFSCLI